LIGEIRFASFLPLLPLIGSFAVAQSPPDCSVLDVNRAYEIASRVTVDTLAGQAVFQPADGSFPLGSISYVCIAVFKLDTGEIISSGVTGELGVFDIPVPGAREFMLIAAHQEFADVTLHVQIRNDLNDSDLERGLLLRMSEQDRNASRASEIENLGVRQELLRMHEADQDIRNQLIQAGMESPDPEIQARMGEIDSANTARLREIVAEYRWPDLALVGHDGASAAFTLLQHAEYAAQKELYPQLVAAYERNEASGQSYALLTDRVLTREGKPQIYGTQARPTEEWIDGEPVFYEIEDEENVDRRRAEVGIPPLSEYAEVMKSLYFPLLDSQRDQSD